MNLKASSTARYNDGLRTLGFGKKSFSDILNQIAEVKNVNSKNSLYSGLLYGLKKLPEPPEGIIEQIRELMKENEVLRIAYKNKNLMKPLASIEPYFEAVNNESINPAQRFFIWLHVYYPHRYVYFFKKPSVSIDQNSAVNTITISDNRKKAEITLLDHKSVKTHGPITLEIDYSPNSIPMDIYFQTPAAYRLFVVRAFKKCGIKFNITEYRHIFVTFLQKQAWYNNLLFEEKEEYHKVMLGHTYEVSQKWYRSVTRTD